MGKYDNYDNAERIRAARKRLEKLQKKRKPDLYKIDIAQKELQTQLLFSSCQIFKRDSGFLSPLTDVAITEIMFSDDHELIWFRGHLIPYKELASYQFVKNTKVRPKTVTRTVGGFSRALLGGMVADEVGAVVGAVTAPTESYTTYQTSYNGFLLQVFNKNGDGWQTHIIGAGILENRIPELWLELATKLDAIIKANEE